MEYEWEKDAKKRIPKRNTFGKRGEYSVIGLLVAHTENVEGCMIELDGGPDGIARADLLKDCLADVQNAYNDSVGKMLEGLQK